MSTANVPSSLGLYATPPPRMSPTAQIRDLPEELLNIILHYVKEQTTPVKYWGCLRTCRQWHRIGMATYGGLHFAATAIIESVDRRTHIVREEAGTKCNLSTDFDLDFPSYLLLSELKSLTVHVQHARIAAPFIPIPGKDFFDALTETFSHTRKLSTFSLKFSDDGWDFPSLDVPAIPQSKLAELVQTLPLTVVNLEIDTAGIDAPPSDAFLASNEGKHLCYQINKIILRLQHLRLRVGHVCESLLACEIPLHTTQEASECKYCANGGSAICTLIRSWSLRGMTVWLPPDHDWDTSPFAHALRVLSMPSVDCRAAILFIRQTYPQQLHTHTPFEWILESNIPLWTRQRLKSWNGRVYGGLSHTHRPSHQSDPSACDEHRLLTRSPQRVFEFDGRNDPKSPYPYMAEWALENSRRWSQHGHCGCRYPIAEGDDAEKPFSGAALFSPGPIPPRYVSKESCYDLSWICLFPGCKTGAPSFNFLRGHHANWHPAQPHGNQLYHGYYACPSAGCKRVGLQGFKNKAELETHLLSHHLRACAADATSISIARA